MLVWMGVSLDSTQTPMEATPPLAMEAGMQGLTLVPMQPSTSVFRRWGPESNLPLGVVGPARPDTEQRL